MQGERGLATEAWRKKHGESDLATEAWRKKHGESGLATEAWRKKHGESGLATYIVIINVVSALFCTEIYARNPDWTSRHGIYPVLSADVTNGIGISVDRHWVYIWDANTGVIRDSMTARVDQGYDIFYSIFSVFLGNDGKRVVVFGDLNYLAPDNYYWFWGDIYDIATKESRLGWEFGYHIVDSTFRIRFDLPKGRNVIGIHVPEVNVRVTPPSTYGTTFVGDLVTGEWLNQITNRSHERIRFENNNAEPTSWLDTKSRIKCTVPSGKRMYDGKYLFEVNGVNAPIPLTKDSWHILRFTNLDNVVVALQTDGTRVGSVCLVDIVRDSILDEIIEPDKSNPLSVESVYDSVWINPEVDHVLRFHQDGKLECWKISVDSSSKKEFVSWHGINGDRAISTDSLYDICAVAFPYCDSIQTFININDGRGSFNSPAIAFHEPGVYSYEIEQGTSNGRIIIDKAEINVRASNRLSEATEQLWCGNGSIASIHVASPDSILVATSLGSIILINGKCEFQRMVRNYRATSGALLLNEANVLFLQDDTVTRYSLLDSRYTPSTRLEINGWVSQADLRVGGYGRPVSGSLPLVLNFNGIDSISSFNSFWQLLNLSASPDINILKSTTGEARSSFDGWVHSYNTVDSTSGTFGFSEATSSSQVPDILKSVIPVSGCATADYRHCVFGAKAGFKKPKEHEALLYVDLVDEYVHASIPYEPLNNSRFINSNFVAADYLTMTTEPFAVRARTSFAGPFAVDETNNLAIAWKDGWLYRFGLLGEVHDSVPSRQQRPTSMQYLEDGKIIAGFRDGMVIVHKPFLKVTTMEEADTASIIRLKVFPNPTSNTIFVSILNQDLTVVEYSITNVLGEKVISDSSRSSEFRIILVQDRSSLPTGVYFLHVLLDNQLSQSRAFVVE